MKREDVLPWLKKVADTQMQLIHAYEELVAASGLEEWLEGHDSGVEEVDAVRRLKEELVTLNCPCCVFGNHTEACACDGASCCHPKNHQ